MANKPKDHFEKHGCDNCCFNGYHHSKPMPWMCNIELIEYRRDINRPAYVKVIAKEIPTPKVCPCTLALRIVVVCNRY